MSHSPASFPPPEEGLRLHLRHCAGEADASADICQAFLSPLLTYLATRFPQVDPDLRQSAVHDALITYLQKPSTFNPARGDLAKYLRMAARGDLGNLLRTERSQRGERVVELGPLEGNLLGREDEPAVQLERDEEAERCRAVLQRLRENCTPEERMVLDLMLEGEGRTAVFARAMGLTGLSAEDEEVAVKRVKDRLKKRLERGGISDA